MHRKRVDVRKRSKMLSLANGSLIEMHTPRHWVLTDIPQENLEKCRYTYQGNETYAFLMSDKYIMALYMHCLVARKEAAIQGMQIEGFTEKEYGMVRL